MHQTFSRWALIALLATSLFSADASAQSNDVDSVAGNDQVAEVMKTFAGKGVMADDSEPTPPGRVVETFRMRDGVAIDLVAHEPEVSQPLFLSWDSRGRMWVVQYRQYQYPAGLKVVRYDQYLRAVFDRVPDPPPRGTPGADKITVLEDTNGDGTFDKTKDVITGLNIATSVQVGDKGIWVLNPPYLLHYPDADRDDVIDGEPEVHLSGFGLQDTHSVANSLTWGPDGWLYGVNGSTTTATVSSKVTKGVSFEGQCVWRYHPKTFEFEIYAEGGGNTFSLEIDSRGRIFSGTNGGNTRGYYYPQGSYSEKNWGKHGPLTNPYAFGFFRAMPMQGDTRRFAQAFLIYEGGLFPPADHGTIVAPNSLHNLVWQSRLAREGSSYRTEDLENLVESSDRWFRPVYSGVGPDGAIYIADWYDTRLSHVSPIDDWHKESGRIYRVRPKDSSPNYAAGDLSQLSSDELVAKFDDPNKWIRQRSVLELGWRGDASIIPKLLERVEQDASLEALWVLHALEGLTRDRATEWLVHSDPDIRRWVVRLVGDRREALPELVALAKRESDVQVRSQLASTAKRIEASVAISVIEQLVTHEPDIDDPHLPLLIWWALEEHADEWDAIERWLSDPSSWNHAIVRQTLVGRLAQRYAAEGTTSDLERCQRLIELAPDAAAKEMVILGFNRAFQGRAIPSLPSALDEALASYQRSRGEHGALLALRSQRPGAIEQVLTLLRDPKTDLGLRLELIQALSELHHPQATGTLLDLATRATDEPALQRASIATLASYQEDAIPKRLIAAFQGAISDEHALRATACRTLASRPEWSLLLLAEVNQWRLAPGEIPADVIQQLRSYDRPDIRAEVDKAFGKVTGSLTPEKLAEMDRLADLVAKLPGDAEKGKVHFAKRCGVCHKLFGEGETIGPALDGYERGNVKFWLTSIVEPSLEIREGYQSYLALTDDGRTLTGMIAAQDPQTVTLRTAENREIVLPRDELEMLKALPTSLMPEDLLKGMSDNEIADLFAHLAFGARKAFGESGKR